MEAKIQELENFFVEDKYRQYANTFDKFVSTYETEEVLTALLNSLKTLAKDDYFEEATWRLGVSFGASKNNYCYDSAVYTWLSSSLTRNETSTIINFLEGYWKYRSPHVDALTGLLDIIKCVLQGKSNWDEWLLAEGIGATVTGLSRSKDQSHLDSRKEVLEFFLQYLSNTSEVFPRREGLMTNISGLLKKWASTS